MSKKGISRFGIRLALIVSVLACAMIACAGAAYADVPEGMLPEKVNGKYEIYNADQLEVYWTITSGNSFYYNGKAEMNGDKGSSCILMNDIDYADSELKPQMGRFSSESYPYTGTLDGNGKTIKNIPDTFANNDYNDYSGTLIVYNNGVIKNVEFDFGTLQILAKRANSMGLLCQYNLADGIISGVTLKGDITSNKYQQLIFCYVNRGAIRNSCALGSLTSTNNSLNALVSSIQDNGVIENVYNGMDMTNTANGIPYGISQYTGTNAIRNCFCSGKLMRGTTEVTALSNNDAGLVNCYKSTDTFTAADLGDAFTDDLEDDPINRGYPVLTFQIDGKYPHVESIDDLTISSIKAVNDTSLSFATDTAYSYYKPKASDFMITATNEDGISVSVTPSSISWAKKSKTLTYSSLLNTKSEDGFYLASKKEQKITVKVEAAGNVLATGEFTIPASDDWRDYGEEPELIGLTDDRYDGKYANYYKITTAEELAWFANNYKADQNAFLAADIDLGGRKWYGIGLNKATNYVTGFSGTFDGNGYTIRNLTSYNGRGLISMVGPNSGTTEGLVKDVHIEDSFVMGDNIAGGIATSLARGSVINCSFSGEVKTEGGTQNYTDNGTGGIVGTSSNRVTCRVTGCANYAKVTGRQPEKTGGVVGYAGTLAIENCYNMGDTNGGGILGDAWGSYDATNITNCYNAGKARNAVSAAKYENVSDCYALAGTGTVTGDVSVFTEEEGKDGTLLEYLGEEFVADTENINDGYPALKWQNPLTVALDKYPEEIEYYVNIDEYGMNQAEVQAIIDDAKAKLANATTAAEADTILAEAKAAIDAIPSDEQMKQNLADEIETLRQQIELANKTLAFDMCLISLDKSSFVYSGSAFEPVITAANKDGVALVKDTDFEVAYEANTEPGVGKVKVTGKGENYAGTRELTFKILPKQNKITSLKKAKKAFTVKWTKDAKATGYQVSYGLKKNFKGAKTVKITKNTTVSKKVSKLKAKKKYFVRVRTYVTSGGQTIYGAWSPVQSVKTK